MKSTEKNGAMQPYLSGTSIWALAVGTSVGWGSLVVTCSDYLLAAGPVGTILGLLIGAFIMLVITRNFCYLFMNTAESGGLYTYTKTIFGYDRAFLIFWFMSLTYFAMLWANATSLPLFAQVFFSGTFRFGYLYTIFDYPVYLGEVLLTLGAILLTVLLCAKSKTATARVMSVLVILLVVGILTAFSVSLSGQIGEGVGVFPIFSPKSSSTVRQILRIVLISPWAFIGFEGVTISSSEFRIKKKNLFPILVCAVAVTTLLYAIVTLLSISAFPSQYDTWFDYIADLGNLGGIEGIPAFYAASHYFGTPGVLILGLSLLALILTSLIGNTRALSRLFFSAAKDEVIPGRFSALNKRQIPSKAILLVGLISCAVPFIGRTAIAWIVDVTTIGAVFIYGFVSAATFKVARYQKDRRELVTGLIGFVLMISLGGYLLLPNVTSGGTDLSQETYFILIVWSILGCIYFGHIVRKDRARRFGKAIIVWLAMLSLIVVMTLILTEKTEIDSLNRAIDDVRVYYEDGAEEVSEERKEDFVRGIKDRATNESNRSVYIVLGLFGLALGVMISNYLSMRKQEKITAGERDMARDIAFRDPLTGVKSKHAYGEDELCIEGKIQNGDQPDFAVVVADVNGLKHINDTVGHQAGDEYICRASRLICEYYKHSPVYRIGGDEFVILLEGADYADRESILRAINGEIEKNVAENKVVVSLGMAEYDPERDKKYSSVFTRADQRMYERKLELKSRGARVRE